MRTLLALLVGVVTCTDATAASPDDSRTEARSAKAEARLRPQDPRLAQLLRAGVARSSTFRSLVNRLEAGRVIVYISLSQRLHSSLAGKLTWMTSAGHFRYLKATLNADQSANQLIATLAHELQHVIEVSEDSGVVDQRSLLALYRRIGRPSVPGSTASWETEAARDMGYQVRRELISAAGAAIVSEQSHM